MLKPILRNLSLLLFASFAIFTSGCESTSAVPPEALRTVELDELDSVPKQKTASKIEFTPEQKLNPKIGVIAMSGVINPDGTVTINSVQETIDEDYTRVFKDYFQSLIYSTPTVQGKPVSASIFFRINVGPN